MAVENYFISLAFRIKDLVQYGMYPVTKMASLAITRNERKADLLAGTAATLGYGGLTCHYSGMELENFDRLVRRAYAAEKGVDADKVQVSDYLDSDNPIIRHRAELAAHLMKVRYGTSMLPMLPSAIDKVLDFVPEKFRDGINRARHSGSKPRADATALEHFAYGYKIDNYAVYAAFAALFVYEQFFVHKTGIYDATKVLETKHDVGRQVSADDLLGIYNRGRQDAGKRMILNKTDLGHFRKVLTHLADCVNKDNKFDLGECIYLMGLDKINPFAKDANGEDIKDANGHRVLKPDGIAKAIEEIDFVEKHGLDGIARMKMQERASPELWVNHTRTDHAERVKSAKRNPQPFNRSILDAQFAFAQRFTPDVTRPGEDISSRDPVR